jgi:EF hand domain-containing protein
MKLGQWIMIGAALLAAGTASAFQKPDPQQIAADQAQLFAQADADGNGVLSPQEFATFESLFRDRMRARHFERMDSNGDGGVSLAEVQAFRPWGHRGCKGGPAPDAPPAE